MIKASFSHQGQDGSVSCLLCNHRCLIKEGRRGRCAVRENRGGQLYSLVYGLIAAAAADPVEKKPLYHFLPGTRTWSIATVGCNLSCQHCQNWQLSQAPRLAHGGISGTPYHPEEVIAAAALQRCQSLSYTYTEPTIFYEFARDCMALAHGRGMANIWVSNGFMTPECCHDLAPLLDAINIDIKGATEAFYRTVCGASLQPVVETMRLLHSLGVWIEITTLVIPGLNDRSDDLARIAAMIASVDPEIPWHVSGFRPAYQMAAREPTPPATLYQARQHGLDAGLRSVYVGNLRSREGETTFCPGCGAAVITRDGFCVHNNRIVDGRCPDCGQGIAGVWRV